MKVLKHIVMWRFAAEAEGCTREQNMETVRTRLRSLVGVVPSLIALEIGEDELHTPASYDMALICTFRDIPGMLAYRDHPKHREISDFIARVTSDRVTADFFADGDLPESE